MYIGNKKVLDIRVGSRRVTRIYDGEKIIYDANMTSIRFIPDMLSFVPTDIRPKSSGIFADPDKDWEIELTNNN